MTSRSLSPAWRDRLGFGLVALGYLVLVRRFWFLTDDAYISFRYMRNWGTGRGLRYNLGEHVPAEGYSNFLLVAIGAVVQRLGGNVETVLPLLTAACGLVLLYIVFRVLRTRFEMSLAVSVSAIAMLAACTPFCVWSTSGLETMPYALLFFATFERLVLRRGGPAPIQAGLLAFALAISRVEGIYWVALFVPIAIGTCRIRGEPCARRLGTYAALVLVTFGAYFTWRYMHFESLVATTVQAKVDLGADRLVRGSQYVAVQYLTSPILFLVLPAALVALRPRSLGLLGPVWLLCVGVSAYATVVGGDFMTFGRLLIPGLAPLAVLWAGLLHSFEQRARGVIPGLALAAVVLAALPGWDLHLAPASIRAPLHFRLNTDEYVSEFEQWVIQRRRAGVWSARGAALKALSEPGDSLVLAAIGATGYYSELFIYDMNGFVTPEVARREVEGQLTGVHSPGHDKSVAEDWFLERGHEPTILRLKLLGTPWGAGIGSDGDALPLNVKRLATALEDDELQDRYVVEFFRVVHPTEELAVRTHILVSRQIRAGMSPAAAWVRYYRAVQDYDERGVAPVLTVAFPTRQKLPRFLERGWDWIAVSDPPNEGVAR